MGPHPPDRVPAGWLGHGLKPMLAGVGTPFDSPAHCFDAKWDGLRSIAFFGPTIRLQARSLRDQTPQFPELAAALGELPGAGVLDGEIVVLDGQRSSFPLVMQRNRLRSQREIQQATGRTPAWFAAFDLLWRDGQQLTDRPFAERRQRLESLLSADGQVFLNPMVEAGGLRFFTAMRERGMEGMVAKRRESRYRIGERSDDWLKCKVRPRRSCVVFGVLLRGANGPVRSLVVGAWDDDRPVWLGNVGSGLDDATRKLLAEQSRRLEAPPPEGFEATGDGVIRWMRPALVAVVEYLEHTPNGHLRHPALVGFEDTDPRRCHR